MRLARQIDAARRRRGSGEGTAGKAGVDTVTPALIRFYDREARALRAEAQAMALHGPLRAPWAAARVVLPLLLTGEVAVPRR